jgi:uncharacterized DUF497 family protein
MPVIFTGPSLGLRQRLLPFGRLALEDDCPYTSQVRFEWDPRKAALNLRRHRVSFDEAVTVLDDDFGMTRKIPTVRTKTGSPHSDSAAQAICWSSSTHTELRTSFE